MSKKLLIDNYSENEIKWDYEKTSENPISIKDLCKEYLEGTNINLNTFSNNQIIEICIYSVKSISTDPQVILLCGKNTGGKVYWKNDILKMGNDSSFNLKLNYPVKLKLTLINNIFSLYINDVLQKSLNVYNSEWLSLTGVLLNDYVQKINIFTTEFRYKNFERG